MSTNIKIGSIGEDLAEEYLQKKGYKILERNYRPKRWGEIDLVAIEDEATVFVEVKTRLPADYGEPQEAVDRHKIQTLIRAGWYFKMENPDTPDTLRIDVVAIILDPASQKAQKLEHFKDVRLDDFS